LSLLLSPVPERRHDEESRLADGLKDTKKCSANDERREAEAGRVAGEYGAPCQNVESKVFGNWHSLQNPVGWVFDD
jgi:hypothetical protein